MTATVSELRTAIIDTLAVLEGLNFHSFATDNPDVPCVIVYPETIDYASTFAGYSATMVLQVLSASVDTEGGQELLDSFIDFEGESSIPNLLHGSSLGGVVSSAAVTRMRNYGTRGQESGPRYYCAELLVDVLV